MAAPCEFCGFPLSDQERQQGTCVICASPIDSGRPTASRGEGITESPAPRMEMGPNARKDAFRSSPRAIDRDLRTQTPADDVSVPEIGKRGLRDLSLQRYRGVRGWLLLFCVSLTIFTPLSTLFTLVIAYDQIARNREVLPNNLMTLVVVDAVVAAAMTVFSICAGILLWSVHPRAVATAQMFLACDLLGNLFLLAMPFLMSLPRDLRNQLMTDFGGTFLRSIVYAFIWMSYLTVSKRVKATYPSG